MNKAIRLRLKKSGNYKNPGCFKKGHKTHNKGKKQRDYMSDDAIERTKATRFKKGRLPHNTRSNYEISCKESKGCTYYLIRVDVADWVLLHRYVWEQAHGPIPDGVNIQFKDRDTSNCDIDNLYAVNRKNQVIVNKRGGKALPYELEETILLINKLKSKINEKQDKRFK